MQTERISTDTKDEWLALRAKDVTSTEVAALFGCSPYLTEYELWHRKATAAVPEIEQTERMTWGLRLEEAIAKGIAEDNGWSVRRLKQYMRLPEVRLGASFDYSIDGVGLLEIKTVDPLAVKHGWLIDGENVEAPPHIELQVQTQLAVSHRPLAYIGVLVGGNRVLPLMKREPNMKVIGHIIERVTEFWHSVDAGRSPSPQYPADAKAVMARYAAVTAGKEIPPTTDIDAIAAEYRAATSAVATAEGVRDTAKARLAALIGDAERVRGEAYTISAGTVKATEIPAFVRKEYRNLRVTWKKTAQSDAQGASK